MSAPNFTSCLPNTYWKFSCTVSLSWLPSMGRKKRWPKVPVSSMTISGMVLLGCARPLGVVVRDLQLVEGLAAGEDLVPGEDRVVPRVLELLGVAEVGLDLVLAAAAREPVGLVPRVEAADADAVVVAELQVVPAQDREEVLELGVRALEIGQVGDAELRCGDAADVAGELGDERPVLPLDVEGQEEELLVLLDGTAHGARRTGAGCRCSAACRGRRRPSGSCRGRSSGRCR